MGLNRKELIKFSALVIGGFGINILGGVVADFFSFPFYLDCIGTILAAVAGGYLPGILVGFFTNLVAGISDYTSSYYSIINILIAVAAAYLTSKGWFKRSIRSAGKILLAAHTLTLMSPRPLKRRAIKFAGSQKRLTHNAASRIGSFYFIYQPPGRTSSLHAVAIPSSSKLI